MPKFTEKNGGVHLALAVAIALAGCGSLKPKVTSSSARTVAVQSFDGLGSAQKLADAECAKYNRFARWVSGDLNYIFDCVN